MSANGAETPRLLLMSENARFPQGLANSSGLVGKYLMFNTTRVHAVFEHELNEYKSVQVIRILHDFYDADPKRGFYGGGGIDARIGPSADHVGAPASPTTRALGQRLQAPAAPNFRARWGCLRTAPRCRWKRTASRWIPS